MKYLCFLITFHYFNEIFVAKYIFNKKSGIFLNQFNFIVQKKANYSTTNYVKRGGIDKGKWMENALAFKCINGWGAGLLLNVKGATINFLMQTSYLPLLVNVP